MSTRKGPRPQGFKSNARRNQPSTAKSVSIGHREYVDYVTCPQAITAYPLQPSSTDTFTWLPAIASRYEMYRVKSCKFSFVSSAGMNTNGSIEMAVDYDSLDAAPTTVEHLATFSSYVDDKIVCDVVLPVSPALSNKTPWHYTAAGGFPSMYDKKMYDFGTLYITTAGDSVANVGRLYVDYVFEFCSPTVEDQFLTELDFGKTYNSYDASFVGGTKALTPVVTELAGSSPILPVGTTGSHTWVDRLAHSATGETAAFKALKGFIGELSWGLDSGPYNTASAGHYYAPELFEASSLSGPWVRKLATGGTTGPHELVSNASDFFCSPDKAGTTGGLLEIVMEAGKYYALPWFHKAGSAYPTTTGSEDFKAYLRSVTGGIGGMFDLIAERQSLQKKALADNCPTKSDSVTKEDETKPSSTTSDAPICRCKAAVSGRTEYTGNSR